MERVERLLETLTLVLANALAPLQDTVHVAELAQGVGGPEHVGIAAETRRKKSLDGSAGLGGEATCILQKNATAPGVVMCTRAHR